MENQLHLVSESIPLSRCLILVHNTESKELDKLRVYSTQREAANRTSADSDLRPYSMAGNFQNTPYTIQNSKCVKMG